MHYELIERNYHAGHCKAYLHDYLSRKLTSMLENRRCRFTAIANKAGERARYFHLSVYRS